MSKPQAVHLAIIGVGGVGKAFLAQLQHLQSRLSKKSPPTNLSLTIVRRSNKQITSEDYSGLSPANAVKDLETSPQPVMSVDNILDFMQRAPGRSVLVDNTSDPEIASKYPAVLSKGVSIVTPNKKAFSDTHALWASIFSAAANGTGPSSAGYIFHESTVGAGLPILSTLDDLLETGDRVTKIQGVFSGTMSFLFNSFQPTDPAAKCGSFSAEVAKAKDLGFTEPDPRDDLNGLDVARKLTILARIAGLPVESPTSFPVQSLIPAALESCTSGDDFMAQLPSHEADMAKLKDEAAKEGKVLRYVGSIDVPSKQVKVGLEKFDASHPIAALKGSDNIVNFYTERYGDNPLIVQGAGAGGEVTAMGVAADLLRVVRLVAH